MNEMMRLCENPRLLHFCVKQTQNKSIDEAIEIVTVLNAILPRHKQLLSPQYKVCDIGQPEYHGNLFSQPIHLEILKCLIKNGVDYRMRSTGGSNLVHRAAKYFSPDDLHEFCRFLIEDRKDHDLFRTNGNYGECPFSYFSVTTRNIQPRTVQMVLNKVPGIDVNQHHKLCSNLLEFIARQGKINLDIIQALVDHGLNYNATSWCGRNALHYAAFAGNLKVLTYFVGLGVSIKQVDKYGNTPLHFAYKSVETIKYLVHCGGDLTKQDDMGDTVVHEAAIFLSDSKFHELAKFLLSRKDEYKVFKMKNKLSQTPLNLRQLSTERPLSEETLELLLNTGYPDKMGITVRDNKGNNPFRSRNFRRERMSSGSPISDYRRHNHRDHLEYKVKDLHLLKVSFNGDSLQYLASFSEDSNLLQSSNNGQSKSPTRKTNLHGFTRFTVKLIALLESDSDSSENGSSNLLSNRKTQKNRFNQFYVADAKKKFESRRDPNKKPQRTLRH